MPLPSDVVERIQRNWETIPPDVQTRLTNAGFEPETTSSTTVTRSGPPAPGVGQSMAEGAGATAGALAGGLVPIPGASSLGAGVGDVLGGGIGDVIEGRPPLEHAGRRFLEGAGMELASKPVRAIGGAVGRAGLRALGSVAPGTARFIESVAPGVLPTGEKVEGITAGLGERLSPLHFGARAKAGVAGAFAEWQGKSRAMWDAVGKLAGDAPVVPTTAFKQMAERQDISKILARATTDKVLKADVAAMMQSDAVPFATARRLESFFRRLSTHRGMIGNVDTGAAAQLKRAVSDDLETFLGTDAGNDVSPALKAAKQAYGIEKDKFNKSIVGRVMSTDQEKILGHVFKPGDITATLDFKEEVPNEVYASATASWLDQLYKKAFTTGKFNPTRFARSVDEYERLGHLEHIVSPETRADLLGLRDTFFSRVPVEPSMAQQAVRTIAHGILLGGGAAEGYHLAAGKETNTPMTGGMGAAGALTMLGSPQGRRVLATALPQLLGRMVLPQEPQPGMR